MVDFLRIIIIIGLVWWAFFRENKVTNILTVLALGIASLISLDMMMNYHGPRIRALGFLLYGTFVIFFIETLIYIYAIFRKEIKGVYDLLASVVNIPNKRDATHNENHTMQTEAREQQKKVINSIKNTCNTSANKSKEYKELYRIMSSFLKSKDIDRFYHFTAVENLESIIKNGGLYSWKGLENELRT